MVLSELQLFQSLKNKLGENQTKDLIEYIDSKSEKIFIDKSNHLATKQDLSNLRSELTKTVYIVGLAQFLAIVSSVVALVILFIK